jgi:hypothetical protein
VRAPAITTTKNIPRLRASLGARFSKRKYKSYIYLHHIFATAVSKRKKKKLPQKAHAMYTGNSDWNGDLCPRMVVTLSNI